MRHLDLPVGVLVDGERVDHPDGVALAQPLELLDDLPVEVRVIEAEHDQLHWSDCHTGSPSMPGDGITPPRPQSSSRPERRSIIPGG